MKPSLNGLIDAFLVFEKDTIYVGDVVWAWEH